MIDYSLNPELKALLAIAVHENLTERIKYNVVDITLKSYIDVPSFKSYDYQIIVQAQDLDLTKILDVTVEFADKPDVIENPNEFILNEKALKAFILINHGDFDLDSISKRSIGVYSYVKENRNESLKIYAYINNDILIK